MCNAIVNHKEGDAVQFDNEKKFNPLDVKELESAKRATIIAVQGISFYEELLSLKTAQKQVKKSSSIVKLDPVLVEGIMCVGGQLQNLPIEQEAKHPALLPKNHHISELIMHSYHMISGHSGLEHTLSLVRQKYWIVQVRVPLHRILNSCFNCRRRQAPVGHQKMAALPEDRSQSIRTSIQLCSFGPLDGRRGRITVKRYGMIFTCLLIGAIHIKAIHSLDTDSFIGAFRRFIARRGQPLLMRSDNRGNFVKANRELGEAVHDWNQDKIHGFLLARNIKWIFNTPAGSHHGGVWERCIHTVQKVMKALMKEQPLDDEGLLTLMCDVEAIING